MLPQLEYWLSLHYKARVLKQGNQAEIKRLIRQRLAADQSLDAAARAELARIDALSNHCGGPSELRKRCFVSWVHREALSAVLNP